MFLELQTPWKPFGNKPLNYQKAIVVSQSFVRPLLSGHNQAILIYCAVPRDDDGLMTTAWWRRPDDDGLMTTAWWWQPDKYSLMTTDWRRRPDDNAWRRRPNDDDLTTDCRWWPDDDGLTTRRRPDEDVLTTAGWRPDDSLTMAWTWLGQA